MNCLPTTGLAVRRRSRGRCNAGTVRHAHGVPTPLMQAFQRVVCAILSLLGMGFFGISTAGAEVRIVTDAEGRHVLLRNGQPYLVRGANWPVATTIGELVDAGGNSVRTYGDEIEWMLPLARQHGLTIMLGLELAHIVPYRPPGVIK